MVKRVFGAICLTLVFTSLTFADAQWAGPGYSSAAGAWGVDSNWDTNIQPVSTDGIIKAYRSDGTGSNITIDTSVSGGVKLQMKYGKSKITINNGGTLTNSGLVEMHSGTTSEAEIKAGGTWNACTGASGANFLLSTNGPSKDTVSVWGTLNITDGSNHPELTIGTTGNVNGYGTLNIYGGGLVNVEGYSVGGRGIIKMWDGAIMKIKGDVTTQTLADIGTKIVGQDGAVLSTYYVEGEDTTYVVPEPATIALLGLGGLMFRKKH